MVVLRVVSVGLLLGVMLLPCLPTHAAKPVDPPVVSDWLGLASVDPRGRAPFMPSAVFERYLWRADAAPPRPGDVVKGSTGTEATWRRLQPSDKGEVAGQGLGVLYGRIHASAEQARRSTGRARIWIARIAGCSVLYVNGVPMGGDVYGHQITRLPVALNEGTNHVYAVGLRGTLRVSFDYAGPRELVGRWDATLPDIVPGEHTGMTVGVLLVNATEETLTDLDVSATILIERGGEGSLRFPLHARDPVVIPPLGSLKVALRSVNVALPEDATKGWLAVVVRREGRVLENHARALEVRRADEPFRITFRSAIDDSAQFYAVRKPSGDNAAGAVLTLHGAGVDALGQARAYAAKRDLWIVAPTNRRPFGFDWQDWGRQDAYEVMADLERLTGMRTSFLTGHSMGGHGTWHLGVNDADRFRAIAPSAGWCSFDTYGGRPEGKHRALWHAADAASDTEGLLENLQGTHVYVLHGTDDDNVPVSEAEHLVKELEALGITPHVHYAEDRGHWWDGDESAGADCVDWPPIFEMFEASRLAAPGTDLRWTTADLSVDAEHAGWGIDQPLGYGAASSLAVRHDGAAKRFVVESANVRRLRTCSLRGTSALLIDGQAMTVSVPADAGLLGVVLERDGEAGAWRQVPRALDHAQKHPARMGPFKRAFDNRFVLVYGTAGHADEDGALLASARYDAEQWRYRANGHAECVTDAFFLAHPRRYRDRNVILYGNATTNAAWDGVLDTRCPIRAERGRLRVGDQTWQGEALGLLLVYPRKGSPVAQVAVVGDTGVPGTRLGFRLPLFLSGVGLPDYVAYGPAVLRRGDAGVLTAGFFDRAWRLGP